MNTSMMDKRTAVDFDQRRFRDALGCFPTGVAIVSGRSAAGELLGTTISSFNSVSLDPPLILFSLSKSSRRANDWATVDAFAVSVLTEEQRGFSEQFGRSSGDKWQGVNAVAAETVDGRIVPDSLATFECRTWARYDGGDHVILVGEVSRIQRHPSVETRPLVVFGGGYERLARVAPDSNPNS